jgi:hypothetical protein
MSNQHGPSLDPSPSCESGGEDRAKDDRTTEKMQRLTMEPASQSDRLFEALPDKPHADPPGEATRSVFARTGILPSQAIRAMIAGGEIMAAPEIEADQIQPASLDLRLMGSAKGKSSKLNARKVALYEQAYRLALASLRGYGWTADHSPRMEEIRTALSESIMENQD